MRVIVVGSGVVAARCTYIARCLGAEVLPGRNRMMPAGASLPYTAITCRIVVVC